MGSLTALDIIVLILVGGGLVLGFMRGFIGEVLSLLAWVAAIVALKFLHTPATAALSGVVLALALVFGIVFIAGKLIARQIGTAAKRSVVGPFDRVLGGGFGALKGLILATLLYLAASLLYDTIYGRSAVRPQWMVQSRTWPLLNASGRAIVDFVEARRTRERRRAAQPYLENEAETAR
jgi:membrane protein required for colicin V production